MNSMILPPVNFLLISFRVIIRLHIFVVAFACKKRYAIAILFFVFLIPSAVFGRS